MARLRLTLNAQRQSNQTSASSQPIGSQPHKFLYCRTTSYDLPKVTQRAVAFGTLFTDIRISVLDHIPKEEHIQLQQVLPSNVKVLASNSRVHALDWRDRCDETGLPLPAIQPEGSCRNKPGCVRWIGECQFESHPALAVEDLPHHNLKNGEMKRTLLCGRCRTIARNRLAGLTFQLPHTSERQDSKRHRRAGNTLEIPDYLLSRGSAWRFWIRYAWLDVCRSCDLEQKSRHPDGYNDCNCYKHQYEHTWLCHRCDEVALKNLMRDAWNSRFSGSSRTGLGEASNRRQRMGHGKTHCLCGKVKPLSDVSTIRSARSKTKRCGLCLGFVVPGFAGRPLRRSERLRKRAMSSLGD